MLKLVDLNNNVVEIRGEFCNPSDFIYGDGNYKKLVIIPSQEFIYLSKLDNEFIDLKKIIIKRKTGVVFYLQYRDSKKKMKINTSMITLQDYLNPQTYMDSIMVQLGAILQMISSDLESDELVIPSYKCYLK